MRGLALLVLALCLAAPGAAAVPRILFIGNSLTAGNDVPGMVQALAAAMGRPVEVELRAYGNYSLQEHLEEPGLDAALAQGWGILVLQQGPSSTPANRMHLRRYVAAMVRRAGGHVGRVALFAPWPMHQYLHTSDDALQSYREAAVAVRGCVLPVVSAWEHQLARSGAALLYDRDGLHATRAGSLLAALTIVRGLVGTPAVDGDLEAQLDPSAAAAYRGHATECQPNAAPVAAPAAAPAEGYWVATAAPGSGLFLELRGEVAGVALFGYQAGAGAPARWWVGNGQRDGNILRATLHGFDRPCADCAPEAREPRALQMEFESSRRAWVRIDDAPAVAATAMPFGGAYAALPDSVDATWGPLPLPDLAGDWLLASVGAQGVDDVLRTTLLPVAGSAGTAFVSADLALECHAAHATARAGCWLQLQASAAADAPRPRWLALGNIGETRLQGEDGSGARLVGLRIAPASASEPVDGLWWDPARPGTGFALARRGGLLALTLFDYGPDGGARWRNASGLLADGTLDAGVVAFHGGGCFGCPGPAPLPGAPQPLRFVTAGHRAGRLEVAPEPAAAVASLAYGIAYLDARFAPASTPLPDLSGTWLLSAPGAGLDAAVLTLQAPRPQSGRIVFAGSLAPGAGSVSLECAAAGADASACVLVLDQQPVLDFPLAQLAEEQLSGRSRSDGQPAVLVRVPARE